MDQIIDFLKDYDLGQLESFEGIEAGVSNTNYHLYTDQGHYILTLFEPHRVEEQHLPFFLSYASHLAACGIPSARTVSSNEGALYELLADRPAAIMTFCEGEHPKKTTPDMCFKVGALTAAMHKAGESFDQQQNNEYGLTRWKTWLDEMGQSLIDISFGLDGALKAELADLMDSWPADLPKGAIHADLFRDNVFFKDGAVSGVIDFHFACTDLFAYDLAIMINAWCFGQSVAFEPERYEALLKGYESVRPLSEQEQTALPVLCRGAALRFTLSRCEEVLNYQSGDLITPHDPLRFLKRLEHFQNETDGSRNLYRRRKSK